MIIGPPTRRGELLQQGGDILLFHWSDRSFESPVIVTLYCLYFLCLTTKNVLNFEIVQNYNICFHNGCFGKYHSDHEFTFPPAITTACKSPASLMVSDSAKDLGRSKENSQTQTGAWERGSGGVCTNFAWSECAAIKNISLPIKDDLWILLQQSYWMTNSPTHSQI